MHGAREHSRAQAVSTSRGRDPRSWAGGPSQTSSSVGPGRWGDGGHGTERGVEANLRTAHVCASLRTRGRAVVGEVWSSPHVREPATLGYATSFAGMVRRVPDPGQPRRAAVPRAGGEPCSAACRRSQSTIVFLGPGPSFPLSACFHPLFRVPRITRWMMKGWIVPSAARVVFSQVAGPGPFGIPSSSHTLATGDTLKLALACSLDKGLRMNAHRRTRHLVPRTVPQACLARKPRRRN